MNHTIRSYTSNDRNAVAAMLAAAFFGALWGLLPALLHHRPVQFVNVGLAIEAVARDP